MRMPGSVSSGASSVYSKSDKKRRRGKRFANRSRHVLHGIVESLENRLLFSVTVPTVPTPAAHWTFDEGTGTIANDSSGNGNTATLGAGVSWVTGNVGSGAISLNGTANSVVTANGPIINTAGSFTVSAWVNLANTNGYQTVVSIAGTNVAGFYLGLRADTDAFSFARLGSDADGTATVVAAPETPLTGTWYQIVGVDDATAGTLTLYVDGQSMGSVAYTGGWQANGNLMIGHGWYSGGAVDYVDGEIDDVQVFSSALSAPQVAALAQPAAWSFDDGSGTTAADITGHGNTLTLGSGATWAAGRIGSNSIAVNGTATGNATNPNPVINTALPFSVSAWVLLNNTSGYQTFVSIDGVNTSGFYLQLRGDTGTFAFTRLASDSDSAAVSQADSTFTPTAGVWYNLIGVNDPATGQIQLYVNGVLQNSVSYTGGWQATGPTVIGGGLFNGARTDFVNGDIDDVHFYDSPLNTADAAYIGTDGSSTINVATTSTGVTVSPNLFGAFMEDINYGATGGIYNDEVQNSGFNDSTGALNAWSLLTSSGVTANLASDTTTGPTSALTQSAKITVTSGVSSSARVGISNSGYFGVAIAPSTTYQVIFYAKASSGFTGPLTVDIESTTGTVWATATVSSISTAWTEYTVNLTTTASTPTTATNVFNIYTNSASANGKTIWIGATYLYPPSYEGQSNHLRIDLMDMLAALKPAIFRVPGGNYLEGDTYATRFNWQATIGPVQDRTGHYNSAWGYWSTDGMGLDEYLQMAEEVGAMPILAVYAGYTLNGTSDTGATLTADVTSAVDELHYCLDPVTTTWGAERAANGHPAPYNIQYVEIGNEDFFSSTYSTRYPLFYNAIHAAFPTLQIIATSTATGGSPYNVLDEHFYETPQWFEANSNYFDTVARGSTQIFIGEYASDQGSPTNDMESALGDASWLLGLEANSDLVTMSSYAPLWANVNGLQWTPDLIGFNNTSAYGSPSYYAQIILGQDHGATVVSDSVSGAGGLQTIVTRTGDNYYLTVINTLGTANNTTIDLSGVTEVSSTGTVTSMSAASSTDTNSITQPTNIVPETSTATGLGTSFDYTFAGYSITVIEFQADNAPTVAQAAASSPAPPVTATSTSLSVLGADAAGESNLTYTWSAIGPANVIFSANGTNAAKNVTATFLIAGTYNFLVTITNPLGGTTTSTLTVVVAQNPTRVAVTPGNSPVLPIGFSQLFSATVTDQFGNPINSPSFTWGITGSNNSINSSGNATLGSTPGTFLVTAMDGSAQGSAVIIAENFAVPSGSTLGINLGSGGAVSLSNTGSTITATQNGEQISFTGVAAITVTDTGSGDVFNFTGPSSIPFTFTGASTSTINVNAGSLTFASAASITLGALNIASGATALMTPSATNTPNVLNVSILLVSGTGKLDMTNSEIFVKYGAASDPISTIYGYLKSGYNNGAWNGPGIISSSAAAQNATPGALQYGIGWADGNDGVHNVPGLSTGQIELRYTLLGDANLDGAVNGTDFSILAAGFGLGLTNWDQGNFFFGSSVNGSDFSALSGNFGQGDQIAAAAPAVVATPFASAAAITVVGSSITSTPSPVSSAPSASTTDQTLHKTKNERATDRLRR